jgi:hypothetical protein
MIPVKGHPHLYRDEMSGAIVNLDNVSYNNYIESRNSRETQRLAQKAEIEKLKNDVNEIKSLLLELINETRRSST